MIKMRGAFLHKSISIVGRIYHWAMTDAGVFLILGVAFFCKGLIYLIKGTPRFTEHILETGLNQEVLGGLWILFGLLVICGCFIKNTYYQASLVGLSAGIPLLWGLEFFKYENSLFLQYGVAHLTLSAMTLYTIVRGREGNIRISKTSTPPLEIVSSSDDTGKISKGETNGN